MPSRNQSGKPEHSFQNPNKKRKKSGKKYEKTMKWYKLILSKKEKQPDSKWVVKTMQKCQERIKKYGITPAQLDAFMAK